MSTYKMESNSLTNLCKKIIFENINLRKNQAIPEGLSKRTLDLMTQNIKEKLKNEGNAYTSLLRLFGISYYYFDDIWRFLFLFLQKKKKTLNYWKKIKSSVIN